MTTPRLRRRDSVFAKMIAIMTTMTLVLLLVVIGLFVVLTRDLHDQIDRGAAHDGLLVITLVAIAGAVFAAHFTLRQVLGPLRLLSDGVSRLGRGELGVRVPRTTGDEFGHLADAFNQMASRVRDMVESRERLLVDVSHELRSPLTRMRVALALLPDDVQRARLQEDVAEMERMVSELLELERLRTPSGLRVAREDLWPILEHATRAFETTPPGARLIGPARTLLVDIDGEKVRTVMRNLLENATKYALPDSRPVEVSVDVRERSLEVRVRDDGAGMPEGEETRVFEPFYRVDRSRTKSTGGYGLGLSICQRVMDALGGSIAVERTEPRGATFVLVFPKPS
ncbi:MAG: ATP-binding protein [Gemmatimonadaceae bacterium]